MYYFYEQNGNLAHHYDLNELTAGYVDEYEGIISSDVLAQNFIIMVRYPENPVMPKNRGYRTISTGLILNGCPSRLADANIVCCHLNIHMLVVLLREKGYRCKYWGGGASGEIGRAHV